MSDGYRALAAAVLLRAVKDAHGQVDGMESKQKRIEMHRCARAFLNPEDEMFAVYCGLLDYDPVAAAEGIKQRGRNVTRAARRVQSRMP